MMGIRKANDDLKEEITAGVKEMNVNIDRRMENTDEKLEDLRKEAEINKEKQSVQEKWMRKMETRMNIQEEEMKWSNFQLIKRNKLQKMSDIQTSGFELAEKLAQWLAKHFPIPLGGNTANEGNEDTEELLAEQVIPVTLDGACGRQLDRDLWENGNKEAKKINTEKRVGQQRMENGCKTASQMENKIS